MKKKLIFLLGLTCLIGTMFFACNEKTDEDVQVDPSSLTEQSAPSLTIKSLFADIKGVEMVERRNESSKTFKLENGHYITRFVTQPVHKKDKNQNWIEMDEQDIQSLRKSSAGFGSTIYNTLSYKLNGDGPLFESGYCNVGRYDGYKMDSQGFNYTEETFRSSAQFSGLSAMYPYNSITKVTVNIQKIYPYGGASSAGERYGTFYVREFHSYTTSGTSTHWDDCGDGTIYENIVTDVYALQPIQKTSGSLFDAVRNAISTDKFGFGVVAANETASGGLFLFNNASLDIEYTTLLTINIQPSQGGNVTPAAGPYPGGSTITLQAFPNPGYRFTNWAGDLIGTINPVNLGMNTNKNVTVNFELIPRYALSTNVLPTGAGTITMSPPPGADGRYEQGTTVTLTATPNVGWVWNKWSGAATSTYSSLTVVVNSNMSIQANFAKELTINGPEYLASGQSGTYIVTTIPEATIYKWYKSIKGTSYPYGPVWQYRKTGTSDTEVMGTGFNPYFLNIKVEGYDSNNNLKGIGYFHTESDPGGPIEK